MGKKKMVIMSANVLMNAGVDFPAIVNASAADEKAANAYTVFHQVVSNKYGIGVLNTAAAAVKASIKKNADTRRANAESTRADMVASGTDEATAKTWYEGMADMIASDTEAAKKEVDAAKTAFIAAHFSPVKMRDEEAYKAAAAALATMTTVEARQAWGMAAVATRWFRAWGIELPEAAALCVGSRLAGGDERTTTSKEYVQSGGTVYTTVAKDVTILQRLADITADTLSRYGCVSPDKIVIEWDANEKVFYQA